MQGVCIFICTCARVSLCMCVWCMVFVCVPVLFYTHLLALCFFNPTLFFDTYITLYHDTHMEVGLSFSVIIDSIT